MWGWLTNDWSDWWVRHQHPGNTEWQFVCVWSMVHSSGTEREQGAVATLKPLCQSKAHKLHPMKSIKTNLARAVQLRAPWTLNPWWINDGFQNFGGLSWLLSIISRTRCVIHYYVEKRPHSEGPFSVVSIQPDIMFKNWIFKMTFLLLSLTIWSCFCCKLMRNLTDFPMILPLRFVFCLKKNWYLTTFGLYWHLD